MINFRSHKKIVAGSTAILTIIASLTPSLPTQAASDLVGYWNFDETSGLISADSSGNSNNGTQYNGIASSTTLPPTSCFTNVRSMHLDGVNDYIEVPDAPSMDPASQITIGFWVRPEIISGNHQHIIFKQGPVYTSYGVWLAPGGELYFETNDNGGVNGLSTTTPMTLNTWAYVTLTYDGSDQKVYLNGALENSRSLPGLTIQYSGSNPLLIGSGTYNDHFKGYIDDLRIYNRALTQQEITDLATGGCGPNVAPPTPSPTPTATPTPTASPTATPVVVPNNGDANDDDIPDTTQPNVRGVISPESGKYVAVSTSDACTLNALSSKKETANEVTDSGYSYPVGFVDYTASCGVAGFTATVKVYSYGLTGTKYTLRKYSSATHGYATVKGAKLQATKIGGENVVIATYTVQDGGPLDVDGLKNGVIVDPVGLGRLAVGVPNTGK